MTTFALSVVLATTANAQLAPYHRYVTLETPHFHVHARVGLEREARVAGAAAERAYALLSRELKAPRGTIDLTVTDDADFSNGYANVTPSNRIVVFATPPIETPELSYGEDWLQLVITHELTHIFHLDRVSGPWALAQHVFGRYGSLFPNAYGPSWLSEGLAVYYESRLTQGGRLRNASERVIARASAIENEFPRIDQLGQGSPRYPGGNRSYVYGSLFMEYLGRTQGDSALPRLIAAQSSELFPFRLNHIAQRAFGTSLSDAFAGLRDSVNRTTVRSALPNYTELTTHPYYAVAPRWRNDSTLVYAGTSGRETGAAYSLSLNGDRTRIGRRNDLGANSPLKNGELLFAQPEYTSLYEIRSDLYIQRANGHVDRLTRGARLVQPDARDDGHIAAIRLRGTESDLLLLTADAREERVLRYADSDEEWSQPRWSPDGTRIAAIKRAHGGQFSLQVIDVRTGMSTVLDRANALLSSPSWNADAVVLYTSEASGAPVLAQAAADGSARSRQSAAAGQGTGIYSPEMSPDRKHIAIVALRADGFHVGTLTRTDSLAFAPLSAVARADTQPLAPGDFHKYSPWPSLVPTYWLPILENAPEGGTRFGASTSGRDIVGRHLYDASLATTTSARATGFLSYRYAGLRTPLIDARISQDWDALQTLLNGGTSDTAGTLLRRSQDAALTTTAVRQRYRTASSISFGAGIERRHFETEPLSLVSQIDTSIRRNYLYPRFLLGAQWSNTQRPPFAISSEDGVSFGFTARERWRTNAPATTASSSIVGTISGFKSLDLPGFAHHVLAARVAGGIADRRSATAYEVGGTSGTTVEVLAGYTIGEGRRTFGVRGFPTGAVYGTQAASGSIEYRAPLVLSGRGFGMLPVYFDRSSISFFADGGVAACAASPLYITTCSPAPRLGTAIGSVGGELVLSLAVFDFDVTQIMRLGVAVPVAGRALVGARAASVYLTFGPSF